MISIIRKPRVGFFFMSPESFRNIGENTSRGTYESRKLLEVSLYLTVAEKTVEVVFPGIVWNHEDVRNAIRQFIEKKVDCVFILYLSWAKDFTLNRFLRDMPPVPVLYAWCLRGSVCLGDTHDEDEFTEYLCCGSLVGTLEGSGDIFRYSRPMLEITSGTWLELIERLNSFANAARARTELKESEIGLLASYNEMMWSTYVDPYAVFMQVGPELHFLSVAELVSSIEKVDVAQVKLVCQELSSRYPMHPDVDNDKFTASVRASIGLEELAEKKHLDLLVLNDVDKVLFDKVGLRPGFYPTGEHVRTVIVPEGDVGGGLAAYFLKLITGSTVHFIEPFHVDIQSDTFEGGHAGPNDYRNPLGKTEIARDIRFAKSGWKYAGAPFAWHIFPVGIHTMLHISQRNGKFILVVTLVESLLQEHHLAAYSHGRFRPVDGTCQDLFNRLLHLGVTQHYALVEGDVTSTLLDIGAFLGFSCHRV